MAGVPVKLTFDPAYPDHAKALELLRAQKHTTQFVVNCILGAAGITERPPPPDAKTSNRPVTRVADELPASNRQATRVTDTTSLDDIPSALLGFIEED